MSEITIKKVTEYTPEIAAGMGTLMTSLTQRATGEPIEEKLIRDIIGSPYHALFVALENDKVVGTATMSVVFGADFGRNAYLESFVVSSEIQGQGIGGKIWDEIVKWSHEQGARRLEFTSANKRPGAIAFYLKKGATIYDTNFFQYDL